MMLPLPSPQPRRPPTRPIRHLPGPGQLRLHETPEGIPHQRTASHHLMQVPQLLQRKRLIQQRPRIRPLRVGRPQPFHSLRHHFRMPVRQPGDQLRLPSAEASRTPSDFNDPSNSANGTTSTCATDSAQPRSSLSGSSKTCNCRGMRPEIPAFSRSDRSTASPASPAPAERYLAGPTRRDGAPRRGAPAVLGGCRRRQSTPPCPPPPTAVGSRAGTWRGNPSRSSQNYLSQYCAKDSSRAYLSQLAQI
jgi:hypothetical protein